MINFKKNKNKEYYRICLSKQPGSEQLIAMIENLDGGTVTYSKDNKMAYISITATTKEENKRKVLNNAQKRKQSYAEKSSIQSNNHQFSMVMAK